METFLKRSHIGCSFKHFKGILEEKYVISVGIFCSVEVNHSKLLLELGVRNSLGETFFHEVQKFENWVFKEEVLKHEFLIKVHVMDIIIIFFIEFLKALFLLQKPLVFLTLGRLQSSPSVITLFFSIRFRDNWHHGSCPCFNWRLLLLAFNRASRWALLSILSRLALVCCFQTPCIIEILLKSILVFINESHESVLSTFFAELHQVI